MPDLNNNIYFKQVMNFNVKEILHRYNIHYQENSYGNEVNILCPFHNDNNFGNAKINEETGLFNCFSCKEGGNIYHFVALLENIAEIEAYRLVNNNFEISNSYDLDKLRNRKIIQKENYNTLSNKIVFNILEKLTKIGKKDFSQRWVIICSYIKNYQKKLNDKQLLYLFSEFNKEIKLL